MNAFQILWIIAGSILGYYFPIFLAASMKRKVSFYCAILFAFIGGLISYTIVK